MAADHPVGPDAVVAAAARTTMTRGDIVPSGARVHPWDATIAGPGVDVALDLAAACDRGATA